MGVWKKIIDACDDRVASVARLASARDGVGARSTRDARVR